MCWDDPQEDRRTKSPKLKELKRPETVVLRECLRGSGMGLSPNIARTAMLNKY